MRPKQGYYLNDGTRVPSVTTIISRFKDAGALMHWAWQCGKDGQDYRDVRDAAASAGTLAHERIRAYVFGKPEPIPDGIPDEVIAKAQQGFNAFLRWYEGSGIAVAATEQSLVSTMHAYGGTVDAIGTQPQGGLCVLDWKTSKGRYPEYLLQLAAYRQLVNESHDIGRAETCHLLWIDKETATFGHFGYTSEVMDQAFQAFLHMRSLYDLDKELRRLV